MAECDRKVPTADETSRDVIMPSGLVTANDYDFWVGITSTVQERRAKAVEISRQLGVEVSWGQCRTVAMWLRAADDKAEAEARGIKTEELDPETGKVIAIYMYKRALLHARAVELAASMTEEDYLKTDRQPGTNTPWPRWYNGSDIRRVYAKLVAESKTDYYGKREG
jgi:hypothetical protein